MVHVLLFHHSQGLTAGVRAFADRIRADGHEVHTPDLFDGRTFDSIDEGMAHIRGVGFDDLIDRGVAAADHLPTDLVHAGMSFGAMVAQKLAQTRPGARGALLFESAAPPDYFGTPWPVEVPVQVHAKDADPFFVGEGDIAYARAIVSTSTRGELFLYPGDGHLFLDSSVPAYDADAAAMVHERVRAFLAGL
ncbi:dienelactone hydrolase family protein [Virgisporangium ochraceum]|uniref:Dienelactone hydrolase n=1 Tax=Virgisporangium ochraceum TaxID=65505 RepID=A0A8J4EEW0_9ACTN|nr:dienelactone hydrolase family protein [Virgisporangium ochraceum]GIJ72131.1 dienelactone hydrolase [Virgisporangium ochraceum]